MPTNTLPDLPAEITPTQIVAWCDALDIDRGEAAAMLGKAPSFWSRFLSGDTDMKLSELNILLQSFRIRRNARTGVNPRNPKEKIKIPAMKVAAFKAGKVLKEAVR